MKSVVRSRKQLLVAVLLVFAGLVPSTIAQGEARNRLGVTIRRLGNPAWVPVDFHVFSAPIGPAQSGYAEFGQTEQVLLPPPHYAPNPGLGIGPGTPEPPPYDHDLADGVEK